MCAAQSQTIPKPDEDIEITLRNERMLEGIEKTTLPVSIEPTSNGEAVVVFTAGAAYAELLGVCLPSEKAAQFAQAISKGLSQTALSDMSLVYGTTEGKGLVKGQISMGAFGKNSSSLNIQIGKLSAALKQEGWKTTIIVRVAKYASSRAEELPKHEGQNYNFFGSKEPAASALVFASASISSGLAAAFYFFLFGPWGLTIAGLLVAFVVAKNQRLPLEKRRAIYPKLALWPTFGSIAIHIPFAMWVVAGQGYRPFADLWFGSASVRVVFPFILIPLAVLMLMLPMVNKAEQKLFGPDPNKTKESDIDPPKISNEEIELQKRISRLSAIPIAIGFALLAPRYFVSSKNLFGILCSTLGICTILFGRSIVERIFRKQIQSFGSVTTNEELSNTAAQLSSQMQTEMNGLRVDATTMGRTTPSVSVGPNKAITVSSRLVDLLEPNEMRGVLAHALAQIKLGHPSARRRMILLIWLAMLPPFLLLTVSFQVSLPNWSRWVAFSIPFLMVLFFMFFLPKIHRRIEHEADRLMLETTRELAPIITGLLKVASNSPSPWMRESEIASTHPAISKRIGALRKIAEELGLQG